VRLSRLLLRTGTVPGAQKAVRQLRRLIYKPLEIPYIFPVMQSRTLERL
jgi:hypothetical protein